MIIRSFINRGAWYEHSFLYLTEEERNWHINNLLYKGFTLVKVGKDKNGVLLCSFRKLRNAEDYADKDYLIAVDSYNFNKLRNIYKFYPNNEVEFLSEEDLIGEEYDYINTGKW